MEKIRVGILFGGKSAEHEISLQSAKNVIEAIDQDKYEVVEIKIGKDGKFNPDLIEEIDVAFPILHGPFGEDGTIQGFLKLFNVPFVGASVLGSAVGMDKDIMKCLLRDAEIPIGKFITILGHEELPEFSAVVEKIGQPFFIKPANMGSSVGVHKVTNENEYQSAVQDAFRYDLKVILEEFIDGREIECSVLGNENPQVSVPGEVTPQGHEFYSYDSKYIDEDGALLEIPAKLSSKETQEIQDLAKKTFQVLSCEGFARVDSFLQENGEVVVNEINTIPGFTKISMYPKLWEASGLSYSDLIDQLIQLALKRFEKESKLKTNH